MKGIKITFEGVTKRVGENINSFEDLKKMILKLFNIPPNTNFTIKCPEYSPLQICSANNAI